MTINSLRLQSPPSRFTSQTAQDVSFTGSDLPPTDSFAPSDSRGWKAGAGLATGLALLSLTGCVAPPPSQTVETQVPQTPAETVQASDLKLDTQQEPLTELQLKQQELRLRERELALREKEVAIYGKAEAQNARLRTLQEQREAAEKGKRTGEAIVNTVKLLDILGQAAKESANSVLK